MGIIKIILHKLILVAFFFILTAGCVQMPKELADSLVSKQSPQESVSPPANGYTWQDLVKTAISKNHDYTAVLNEAQAEYYRYKARTDIEDLRLTFDFALRDATDNNRSRFGGDLRFYIPNPFVNKHEIRAGIAAWGETKASADEIKYEIALTVYKLFHEVLSAEKTLDILRSREQILSDWADHLSVRQSVRLATQADIMSLELQRIRLKSSISQTQLAKQAALRSLQILVQINDDDLKLVLPPADWQAVLASLSDKEKIIEDAFASSWELAAANASYEKAGAMLGVAKAKQIPWFGHVQAGYNLRSTISTLDMQPTNEFTVQLMINLPLFAWLSSEKKRASALMQAAELRKTGIRESIRNTITGNIKDLEEAVGLLSEYASLLDAVSIPSRESTPDTETYFRLMDTRLSAAESVVRAELHCAFIYSEIMNVAVE